MAARPAPVIAHLAVIGAVAQGCALARLAAQAGFQVTLEDLMPARRRAAATRLDGLPDVRLAATVEEAVREADLVVDFVPDELESKLEILSLLDRMAPPHTILAMTSRALSIADLASCTYRPERCVALRLPARLDQAAEVEVIHPPLALPEVLEAVTSFWQALGASVSVAADTSPLP